MNDKTSATPFSNEGSNTDQTPEPGSLECILAASRVDNQKDKEYEFCTADFKWIVSNERAAYWIWLFIRDLYVGSEIFTASMCYLHPMEGNPHISSYTGTLYDYYWYPRTTSHSKERMDITRRFFERLTKDYTAYSTRQLFNAIKNKWSHYVYPVKNQGWIKKLSGKDLEWAWDYFKIKLGNSALNRLNPVDENEMRLAIVGAIDFYFPGDNEILIRKTILTEGRNQYTQRKRRSDPKSNKAKLNAEIDKAAKNALVMMARDNNTTIKEFLEKLILSAYIVHQGKK